MRLTSDSIGWRLAQTRPLQSRSRRGRATADRPDRCAIGRYALSAADAGLPTGVQCPIVIVPENSTVNVRNPRGGASRVSSYTCGTGRNHAKVVLVLNGAGVFEGPVSVIVDYEELGTCRMRRDHSAKREFR